MFTYIDVLGKEQQVVILTHSQANHVVNNLTQDELATTYFLENHKYEYGSIYVFNALDYLDLTFSEIFFWSATTDKHYGSLEEARNAFKEKHPCATKFTSQHRTRLDSLMSPWGVVNQNQNQNQNQNRYKG